MPRPLANSSITAEQIDRVVTAFYERIRTHPILGPIFVMHIPDDHWPQHEAKIAGFWRNAILREGSYSGNPMRVHMETFAIEEEHFPIWLGLFDQVLIKELPPETAQAISELAHRIARGFVYGLSLRKPESDVPILC